MVDATELGWSFYRQSTWSKSNNYHAWFLLATLFDTILKEDQS